MKKNIYITALHLLHGGVEMAIASLANALAKRDYNVTLLCTYNLGSPAYYIDPKVNIEYLTDVKPNREAFKNAIRQKNIFAAVKEGFYALKVLRLKKKVLINSFKNISDGVIISTRNEDSVLLSKYGNNNVLKIAQLHHDHCFDKKLINDFKNHYGNIDIFTLLTETLTAEVTEIMKKNLHTKCITLPNFLPENDIFEEKEVVLENQAVAVGRLHPVKGFLRLIEIWGEISKKSDTKLKIIGGGEQREELSALIKKLDLEDKVILTGALDHNQVLEEMQKSIFYTMTSTSEGFGFVLIEAMSQGTPAIAFDVRVGPRAIIDDKINGFLIKDGEKEAFVQKALFLINNPEEREKLSRAAKLKSHDFSEDKLLEKWENLFNSKESPNEIH